MPEPVTGWRRLPYLFTQARRRVVWGGLAVLFSALIVLVTLIAATQNAVVQRKEAAAWHAHSVKTLLAISELDRQLNAAVRGERGYLITGDEVFLKPYEAARQQAPEQLVKLRSLMRSNPQQQELLAQLDQRTAEFFELLETAINTARTGNMEGAFQFDRSSEADDRAVMVFDLLEQIESQEQRLLDERLAHEHQANMRSRMIRLFMISFGIVLVLLAFGVGLMALDGHVRALEANRALAHLAVTDPLTGLPNRRSFHEELGKISSRSSRSGAPFSIAVFDIDFFKSINDTYGHLAGDAVLRGVAQILRSSVRDGDVAARMGGEEFALLMPDTSLEDAGVVCERVRRAVEAHRFVVPSGQSISTTISAGAAQVEGKEEGRALASRADAALYAAKRNGRNRVVLAGRTLA